MAQRQPKYEPLDDHLTVVDGGVGTGFPATVDSEAEADREGSLLPFFLGMVAILATFMLIAYALGYL
jgi:hypothetical protein